ncbi:AtpZ/AtpI family protein [Roseivirga sp.]|nr:AtpZ/AtpI family protein [Roseivirga sp.]
MPQKEKSKGPNNPNSYLKYSQLGIQLFLTIGVCAWLGFKMDESWNNGKPLFIILMILVGTTGAIYMLYKSLPKD